MATIRGPARAICTLASALLILTGCDKLSADDTQWARAALERNPDLTIVAADKDAKTFTVQVKGSPDLRVVRVDQVIGDLPSDGVASPVQERGAPASPSPAEAVPAPESTAPSQSTASAGEPAQPVGQQAARNSSLQVNSGVAPGTGVVTDRSGKVITYNSSTAEVVSTESPEGAAAAASAADKKVLASGPGYSISAGDPRASRPLRLAEATELKSPANTVMERRYEPMICQGNRLLHIDNRNLEFEGDGLSALDGCEIHITNSHIIAHGLGISARAANVHIKNSIIEGDSGSISASGGAKVYTQQSTFKGLSRRLDTASFQDFGGTTWN
jgi:hypothetical protein